ncbi:MAG: FecR domain-containing protein [Pseudosphingobacterium sp.]|nr:FecR domain-containing protein [Olivibacter sp. UJ_SKK_5.1]MDX3914678.1 FecR domain-containing protein [Pseudosphingobacterium sp.]
MNELLVQLFAKYLRGMCNHEEINRVVKLLQEGAHQEEWEYAVDSLAKELASEDAQLTVSLKKTEYLHQRILRSVERTQIPIQRLTWYKRNWLPYAVATALVVFVTGALFYRDIGKSQLLVAVKITENDIQPASSRATLALADGRTIMLNGSKEGIITADNGITYQDRSEKIVHLNGHTSDQLVLTTPRGGTYTVVLPDGSKAWLNAASSLKYPSHFTDNERLVEIQGEAYFMIVKDAKRPFKVRSKGQEVEVLGTEFNVSAYPEDNEIKTTLVSGAVQVAVIGSESRGNGYGHQSKDSRGNKLLPGEQSTLKQGRLNINKVDVSTYVGWKDGDFIFNGLELREAMKQLSRWYDVEVVYEGAIPPTPLYGSFSRAFTLSKTLEILKEGRINFKLEKQGTTKRLIVKQ